jgi:hypothetical protein
MRHESGSFRDSDAETRAEWTALQKEGGCPEVAEPAATLNMAISTR